MKKFTIEEIGAVAGKVWGVLSTGEEMTVSAIAKAAEEDQEDVAAAIGWLLREDKLNGKADKRSVKFSLK